MGITDICGAEMTQVLCIGSVLWDVIGRTSSHMQVGSDVPGRITRLPGGVAMNIAMTLVRFGMQPVLLSAVGQDEAGTELISYARNMGLDTSCVYRSPDLPTDVYMAVEGANGLIAAIADAHSLEAAGDKILRSLGDGSLGAADAPYAGCIALDGNLTEQLLAQIARDPLFSCADLRVAPASPGKARRLRPLFAHPNATFYVNLEEAGLLAETQFENSSDAAQKLCDMGAPRAMVTDGARSASFANRSGVICQAPPEVMVTRVTGAGDTFMAAHIAAELKGANPEDALSDAINAAAHYISGETPYD